MTLPRLDVSEPSRPCRERAGTSCPLDLHGSPRAFRAAPWLKGKDGVGGVGACLRLVSFTWWGFSQFSAGHQDVEVQGDTDISQALTPSTGWRGPPVRVQVCVDGPRGRPVPLARRWCLPARGGHLPRTGTPGSRGGPRACVDRAEVGVPRPPRGAAGRTFGRKASNGGTPHGEPKAAAGAPWVGGTLGGR